MDSVCGEMPLLTGIISRMSSEEVDLPDCPSMYVPIWLYNRVLTRYWAIWCSDKGDASLGEYRVVAKPIMLQQGRRETISEWVWHAGDPLLRWLFLWLRTKSRGTMVLGTNGDWMIFVRKTECSCRNLKNKRVWWFFPFVFLKSASRSEI